MHVIATAGHVDHGKSTLVRRLTGMEPDRWDEERRRGLTIDLGFAWTALPSGATVAFVDVPGHARFVPNMLAGVGPVPAVMFVVAADEGWMPQSTEHLDALAALDVRHGLLVVTRCDRADPTATAAATAAARRELAGTPLAHVPAVAVSGATGAGLDDLRAALETLVRDLPTPDRDADVRLWVDRAFTVRGAGTVVTGTLAAGTVRTGDELVLSPSLTPVTVRGLQSLGSDVDAATAVARVAVNLRGLSRDRVRRGHALLAPGRWRLTSVADVRLDPSAGRLRGDLHAHIGSAAQPVRVRPFDGGAARLTMSTPLPLRVGDRLLLRDPGGQRIVAGAVVLDVAPPPLTGRGAGRRHAAELSTRAGRADAAADVRRRGLVRGADLRAMGVPPSGAPVAGDWYADPDHWRELGVRLDKTVRAYLADHPLEDGMPEQAVRRALGLPDQVLLPPLVAVAALEARDGRVAPPGAAAVLPPPLRAALDAVRADLAAAPYAAPEAHRLAELGLGRRELAALVRAGALVHVGGGAYLLPGAVEEAADRLAALSQPFTLSEARQALGTTRRVAVPLLELLDRLGRTTRDGDLRRTAAGSVRR